jgi:Pyruvate/2-oxoacid:ferredoxin oxidoreductase gamma subunit
MEREILMAGIGGQGVQLAASILAEAATIEGRHVLSLGTYGGTMRGGNTDSTVVVADAPVVSPPVVSRCWAALVMHPRFAEPTCAKLRAGGLVFVDADVHATAGIELELGEKTRFDVPAQTRARAVEAPRAGSLVLLGALCGATGLVELDALVAAMESVVPSYRRQHVDANARALAEGHASVEADCAPAWQEAAA